MRDALVEVYLPSPLDDVVEIMFKSFHEDPQMLQNARSRVRLRFGGSHVEEPACFGLFFADEVGYDELHVLFVVGKHLTIEGQGVDCPLTVDESREEDDTKCADMMSSQARCVSRRDVSLWLIGL